MWRISFSLFTEHSRTIQIEREWFDNGSYFVHLCCYLHNFSYAFLLQCVFNLFFKYWRFHFWLLCYITYITKLLFLTQIEHDISNNNEWKETKTNDKNKFLPLFLDHTDAIKIRLCPPFPSLFDSEKSLWQIVVKKVFCFLHTIHSFKSPIWMTCAIFPWCLFVQFSNVVTLAWYRFSNCSSFTNIHIITFNCFIKLFGFYWQKLKFVLCSISFNNNYIFICNYFFT